MVGNILGNYLVETGKITSTQFQEIIEATGKVRVKLGLIAVSEGYMTADQAEEVNRLQAVMDKRFGDIAVENGYLTDEQVGDLLKKQGNEYLVFLQALVDMGICDMAEADQIILNYQKDKQLTDDERDAVKSGDVDRIIPVFLPQEAREFQGIIGVAVRTIIRCVDRDICLKPATMADKISGKNGSFQTVEGANVDDTTIGLVEDNGGFLCAASLFSGEEFATLDEDALDSCAELLNCINGIYASFKSKEAIELELLPPMMHLDDVEYAAKHRMCILPISIKGKDMRFVVWN